ncbi:hypothetical protein R4Z09_10570 [Niallia oryzisoli]|uniref:Uncharacterized protein n=1 Tax=Niallia oryzisoli TaxID=1737571 RepID=A0ABZ2CI83_9BACI
MIINDTSSYRADIMPYGGIDKSGARQRRSKVSC